MWFKELIKDENYCDSLDCCNFVIKGFQLCIECLPSQEQLLTNYKKWNRKYTHKYETRFCFDEIHFNTNCILTANMLRKKFGFGIGMKSMQEVYCTVEKFLEMHSEFGFSQVEIYHPEGFVEHIFTLIGKFLVHSFQSKYELKFKEINEEWKQNLITHNFKKICEDDDDFDPNCFYRFYFPMKIFSKFLI